jgi:hypothetical protein
MRTSFKTDMLSAFIAGGFLFFTMAAVASALRSVPPGLPSQAVFVIVASLGCFIAIKLARWFNGE